MSKTRLFQLFAARESQAGVLASGLIAAANAKIQVKDLKCTYNAEQYRREINRGSLSPLTTISGVVDAQMTFSVELAGTTNTASTVATGALPVWAPLIEACGMEQRTIKRIGLAATFGGSAKVFEHGEVITGGTSGSTAMVVHDTWEGQACLRIVPLTGSGITANELITGGTNGATSTNGGLSNSEEGVCWSPYSLPEISMDVASMTGTVAQYDVLRGNTSGAIVQTLQAITTGATGLLFRPMDGTITSGETFTNLTQTGTIVNVTNMAQTKLPTLSLACVEDSRIKTLKGCRGTFTLTGEIGKPAFMNFTFRGQLVSIVDGGPLDGIAYETPVPPKFMGHEFKVGGYGSGEPGKDSYTTEHTPRVTKFSIDYGNTTSLIKDATQSTGVVGVDISDRQTKGSIDPEIRPEGSFPFAARLKDGVPFRTRLTMGSANKNRFDITMPGCKASSESIGDRDGHATGEISFDCSAYRQNGSDGDKRELIMTYSNLAHAW